MNKGRTNRLAGETSPYLLQHAQNPVDWYPWGEEALTKARAEDRPIFLSIGYAACHWCHVMERESFENGPTAALMNEHFVSIKVDREERPDLDGIYMDAVQALNQGQGGWPMSVFLTPDGKPFYAGTYFPKEPRFGMPSFTQVLAGIAEAWRDRRDDIEVQGSRVTEAVGAAGRLTPSSDALGLELEREALVRLRRGFDATWGGFGGAPKFPQPMTLEFLLRMASRGELDALEMVVLTLDRMADGGIHDQIGGGFARYATDAAWHVPHFEKMLYDNAQLALLYTDAWLLTRNDRYRDVAVRTLDYLLREMQHPGGGFFSSQDADSEGVEGKFFVWRWEELVELVGEPVATAFGATLEGNWEGSNVLWHPEPVGAVAMRYGIEPAELEASVADARPALLEARARRVRPGTDDKILTAWNALAIRAFAVAGRAFGERRYVDAAIGCASFVWQHLRDERGGLLRSWRDGTAGGPGFADDHAALALALLTLYERTSNVAWFTRARELGDELLRRFRDDERGGFFLTPYDGEQLVVRPKEFYDNAIPSGNSLAAEALLRLAMFTGENVYEASAVAALALVREAIVSSPSAFGHALNTLDLLVGPRREVAIVGDPDDKATAEMVDEVFATRFVPNAVLAFSPPGDVDSARHVPLLRDRKQVENRPTAYVCEGFVCQLPVTESGLLAEQLAASRAEAQ